MPQQRRYIPVSQTVIDRLPLDPRILSLVRHIENGGHVPPIHVQVTGTGQYRVLDGRHRLLAHRLLGRVYILARLGEETSTR